MNRTTESTPVTRNPQDLQAAGLQFTGQSSYVDALLDAVADAGISAAALFAAAAPSGPRADLVDLCAAACVLVEDPALGLRLGAKLDLTSHGILGYALMSSATVDQALQRLGRYISLTAPRISLQRVVTTERCLLVCVPDPDLLPRQFFLDAVLTSILVSATTLFGDRVGRLGELWLTGRAPAHAAAYQDTAGVRVRFQQPHNAAVMPRAYLDAPVRSADPLLEELCQQQCETLLAGMRRRHGLAARLREQLLRQPGAFPTLPEVAVSVGSSERSLRRSLAAEGTSWRQLLDEVRLQLARSYLVDTTLTVADIAHLLGYEDVANFRRAFRRLQGQAPVAYRDARAARTG